MRLFPVASNPALSGSEALFICSSVHLFIFPQDDK